MGKEDIKATLLEIIAIIHTFGGGVLIGFFSFIQSNPVNFFTNNLSSISFLLGIVFFIYNFFVISNAYNDKIGEIRYSSIREAFNISILTMVLFIFGLFLLIST